MSKRSATFPLSLGRIIRRASRIRTSLISTPPDAAFAVDGSFGNSCDPKRGLSPFGGIWISRPSSVTRFTVLGVSRSAPGSTSKLKCLRVNYGWHIASAVVTQR